MTRQIVPIRAPERCVACGMPMRSLDEDWLVLMDLTDRSSPSLRDLPVHYLVHGFCVGVIGDHGYSIQLRRIVEVGDPADPHAASGDSFHGWVAHLRTKKWRDAVVEEWLARAHEVARQLAAEARRG